MAGFNPSEARDRLGRWTRAAGAGAYRAAGATAGAVGKVFKKSDARHMYRAKAKVAGAAALGAASVGAGYVLGTTVTHAALASPIGALAIYQIGKMRGRELAALAKKKKATTTTGNGSTIKPGSPSGKAVATQPPHYARPGRVNHIRGKLQRAAGDKATQKGR